MDLGGLTLRAWTTPGHTAEHLVYSLGRLLTLPDATPVYPTHGAGSFCSAPPGAERTTTIGRERATNPLLAAGDEDAFVKALLAGLGTFPPYFLRLPEENRRGRRTHHRTPTRYARTSTPTSDSPAARANGRSVLLTSGELAVGCQRIVGDLSESGQEPGDIR